MKLDERTETERPQVVVVESSRPHYIRPRYYYQPYRHWWSRRNPYRGYGYKGSLWYRLGLIARTMFCMVVLFLQFLMLVYILGR
jgi:hypothetical protein